MASIRITIQEKAWAIWQTEKYFKLIGEQENFITIPRGFLPNLIAYCKKQSISCQVVDCRKKKASVTYHSSIKLYPMGSGKTIMGLELIARKRQPALIIVNQIFQRQW